MTYAMLRPPAATLDADLPAELRQLLLINDGADESERSGARFLPGMHRLLPAGQIAEDNTMHIGILASLGDDEMVGRWWHPQWIVIGSDGAGHRLVIDDRRGPGWGGVWEWSRTDGLIWELAPSIGEFIADVANALQLGSLVAACRFSSHLASGRPLAWASSTLLIDLASDLCHRSDQFLRP